tara:strand:+ start:1044 stop:1745 length:702 start_codon:yes stop_codon:yes gene_type:complete
MKFIELTQEPCWSNDKSVAYEAPDSVALTETHNGKMKNIRIFVPNSMISERDGDSYISSWLVQKKRIQLKNLGYPEHSVDQFLDGLAFGKSFEKDDERFKLVKIFDFLDKASANLDTPKMIFDTSFGRLKINRAGSKSKHEGKIFVTNGGDWGSEDRLYYGAIDLSGLYTPTNIVTKEIKDFLLEVNEDPEGFTTKSGKTSGNCCFCQRALTTERSKEAGYGPGCSGKYGMKY